MFRKSDILHFPLSYFLCGHVPRKCLLSVQLLTPALERAFPKGASCIPGCQDWKDAARSKRLSNMISLLEETGLSA